MNVEFWEMLERIVESCEIVIDRPRGSYHPKYHSSYYEIDYGHLKDTMSSDGSAIDIWVGESKGLGITAVCVTVDEYRKDSEIKILYDCDEEEINTISLFHNQNSMRGLIIRNERNT